MFWLPAGLVGLSVTVAYLVGRRAQARRHFERPKEIDTFHVAGRYHGNHRHDVATVCPCGVRFIATHASQRQCTKCRANARSRDEIQRKILEFRRRRGAG